jgi:cytochrome c biogenesis protein
MATSKSNVTSGAPEGSAAARIDVPTNEAVSAAGNSGSWLGAAIDSVLKLLSSVRFGLVMLGILLTCCMIGMLIMQVSVEGFQKYYNELSPAKRLVFGSLGFFDIYHAWYFSLLLAITGLNIILASIDRFPTAWQYIRKPKLAASPKFVKAQMYTTELAASGDGGEVSEEIRKKWRKAGFRVRVTPADGRTTVFAQRFAWNRLGAYAVHVALLTIFTGGFLTNRYGAGGNMWIEPGRVGDQFTTMESTLEGPRTGARQLPFKIECLDVQQKLIRPEGGLDQQNTIDWLSDIRILDGERPERILVHLNNVGSYRGYRFFQSSFSPEGYAREVTVVFQPVSGGDGVTVKLGRGGNSSPRAVDVPGIGKVTYVDFYPDFAISGNNFISNSGEYNKPVAQLDVQGEDGKHQTVLALGAQASDLMDKAEQRSAAGEANQLLYKGNKIVLKNFEKVSRAHALTIQYDPGRTPVYIGFVLLLLSLCSVFFFSHQRVWAVVEPDESGSRMKVYVGGNVNRNRQGFEETFNKMAALANSQPITESRSQ